MSYQRQFARTLRVGVVGVGSHAYRNVLPTLHYLPVRLAALCDLNEELLVLQRQLVERLGKPRQMERHGAKVCGGPDPLSGGQTGPSTRTAVVVLEVRQSSNVG